jgi:hypothetical protein
LGWHGTDDRTADESAAPGRMTPRFAVTLVAGPLLFVVLAAFLRQYPLVGKRLCFFLLPCTMLAAALGADLLAARLRGVWPRVVAGLLALVVAGTAVRAASITLDPRSQGDVRSAVRHVLANRAPGEPVYVWGGKASSVVRFYVPHPDENIHLTSDYRKPPEGQTFWVIAQLGRWGTTTEKHDERFEEKLAEMRMEMTLTDSLKAHRVGAYRFSREAPPAARATPGSEPARRLDASRGG